MPAHHFIVARSSSHWKVSFHGTEQSPFETKEGAIEAAVDAARIQSAEGLEVEVLVQDIDSTFRTAWKSGAGDGGDAALAVSE